MHNEELHKLYETPNDIRVIKSRRMSWEGHVASMGHIRHKMLVGKPERKRTLGRPTRRWEGISRMDRETGLIWLRIGTSGGLL